VIDDTAVPTLSEPPRSAAATGTTAFAAGVAACCQSWVSLAAAGSSLAGTIVTVADVLSVRPFMEA
jgi:organic hydroperoxide reductase OsmC/OhrA